MALTIAKPSDLKYAKSLTFSPPGHGKTVLLGTAQDDPRTAPMLLLDFEGGTESLSGLDIDVARIRSWEDYNEAYELLLSNDHGYKSVGVDSISETHIWALLDILNKEGPTRKDAELLEQRDYGKASVQMRRFLRSFRDLPLHVFFTAHAKEVEIPRQGRVQLPSMSGQMAEEVVGLMSIVGYLAEFEEVNPTTNEPEMHRTLLLRNFAKFRIKARTPWGVEVPDEIIDPTVTKILDVMGYPMPGEEGLAPGREHKTPGSRRSLRRPSSSTPAEPTTEQAEPEGSPPEDAPVEEVAA